MCDFLTMNCSLEVITISVNNYAISRLVNGCILYASGFDVISSSLLVPSFLIVAII